MKKIFIAGGSGLLGVGMGLQLRDSYSVVLGIHSRLININGCDSHFIEYSSHEKITKEFAKIKPDIVVNAAALTNLGECELWPAKAEIINVEIAKNIAIACKSQNIKLVHISTDQLTKGTYSYAAEGEVEPSLPLNVYGKTKASAEIIVSQECKNALIIRTNFFGWGTSYRQSFSDFVIKNLRIGNQITLYTDIFYTPILREQLVEEILSLLDCNAYGIFNIGCDERLTKYDFGLLLANKFNLNKKLIISGKCNNSFDNVNRPKDMSLSTKKIYSVIKEKKISIESQIKTLYEQEKNQSMRVICDL